MRSQLAVAEAGENVVLRAAEPPVVGLGSWSGSVKVSRMVLPGPFDEVCGDLPVLLASFPLVESCLEALFAL